MSVAKKPASKDKQSTSRRVQQIITNFFTPRENKLAQRRPIIIIPEVETKDENAAKVTTNKQRNGEYANLYK